MTVTKAKRQHFLTLDLLRGIAAVSVIFLHWLEGNGNPWFHNSHMAVDFFFILSGFVMAYSYTDRLKQGLGPWKFFLLRLIRLYPMIIVGIIFGLARFSMRTIMTHDPNMTLPWLLLKMVQNLFMIPNFQDGWSADMFILNLALWSLFFEFVAYILYGLFLYRASLGVLIALTVVSGIGVWAWLYQEFEVKHVLPYLSFEKQGYLSGLSRVLFSFTLGLLSFEAYKRIKFRPAVNGWFYAIGLWVFLTLPLGTTSPTLAFLALLIAFPLVICFAASAVISPRTEALAKFCGDISYPLYVVHTPLIWLFDGVFKVVKLKGFIPATLPNLWFGVLILPSVVVISYVLFKVYDEPVRKYLMNLYRKNIDLVVKV